jgi:hypothetical protein
MKRTIADLLTGSVGNQYLDLLGEDYQSECSCGERGRPDFRHADSCPVSPWYIYPQAVVTSFNR